jgi:hypothetical protein
LSADLIEEALVHVPTLRRRGIRAPRWRRTTQLE